MTALNPENLASTVDQTINHLAAESKLDASKDHAAQAVRDIKDAAVYKAREVKEGAVQKAEEVRRKVESSVKDARLTYERKAREKPLASLLYAFGAGFVLGLIIRR